jgi:hypothetical protein
MTESELKPYYPPLKLCPFCGTKVRMLKEPLWRGTHGYHGCFEFSIKCPECGCTLDYINNDSIHQSEEEAIANVAKAWNRRKELKEN